MTTQLSLFNETADIFLAMRVRTAYNFWHRLKGWMGKKSFREGEALLLKPCRSIHTCFMLAPIDVVYLDRDLRVVGILERVRPYRFPRAVRRAHSVVELPAGTVALRSLRIFDQLRLIEKKLDSVD